MAIFYIVLEHIKNSFVSTISQKLWSKIDIYKISEYLYHSIENVFYNQLQIVFDVHFEILTVLEPSIGIIYIKDMYHLIKRNRVTNKVQDYFVFFISGHFPMLMFHLLTPPSSIQNTPITYNCCFYLSLLTTVRYFVKN